MSSSDLPLLSRKDEEPQSCVLKIVTAIRLCVSQILTAIKPRVRQTFTAINLSLIIISYAVLFFSVNEEPSKPLRVWIYGYIGICLFQAVLSFTGLCSRNESSGWPVLLFAVYVIASSSWWMVGIEWLTSGGHVLLLQAPHLFWLTAVLIALPFVSSVAFLCCYCCLAVLTQITTVKKADIEQPAS